MPNRNPKRLLALPLLAALLAGCIGGRTPPSDFYLLEPIKTLQGAGPGEPARRAIALAPVRIPQYVDRPQMVTATARNAYTLSEFHRWAERLDDGIARVLALNLSLLVPTDRVSLNASGRNPPDTLRVAVTLLEFHVDPAGQAVLAAQWNVARGEASVSSRQAGYREPASATDYAVMAGALNECLNRLSRDVALDLRRLEGGGEAGAGGL
jgi:uncharacterized lipoprotein YmbA